MKKIMIAFIFLALTFTAKARAAGTFTWTDSNLSYPTCGAANCANGYIITDVTVSASPVVIATIKDRTVTTYTLAVNPSIGVHTYNIVGTFLDQSGKVLLSAPATATGTVNIGTPNAPGNFTVTFQ